MGGRSRLGARTDRSDRLGRSSPSRVQQITVPTWVEPPRTVALRIAGETYETAALPLSYVGAVASIGDALKHQLISGSGLNGRGARIERSTMSEQLTVDGPTEASYEARSRATPLIVLLRSPVRSLPRV